MIQTRKIDNGQHFGDHRIPAGKRQAYETDVLVPFFVRGPGIKKGTSTPQVVQSVDLGPTFLDVASSSSRLLKSTYPMDGKSILPLLTTSNAPDISNNYNDFRWAALLEMYSGSSNIGLRYNHTKGYYRNHMVRMVMHEMGVGMRMPMSHFFLVLSPILLIHFCFCLPYRLFLW